MTSACVDALTYRLQVTHGSGGGRGGGDNHGLLLQRVVGIAV